MIATLKGTFLMKTPTRVIMEVQGVGYDLHISLNTYAEIADLESGQLFTYLKVSEDALTLFGFFEEAEKEMFLKLTGVSGVGGATARMVLNSLKAFELQEAILYGNVKLLESVKGIGKKTAERIILELRDKVGTIAATQENRPALGNTKDLEALEALVALGIGRAAADQALKKAKLTMQDDAPLEQYIKMALKSM